MEIAVFGGTFDPPTRAHEGIIRACLSDPRFDEVWVMPSGIRSDKPHMSSDIARLAMLDIVKQSEFNNDPRLRVTDFELKLPRPTQTYLTHLALREAFPESTFWYVFGADSYATMETWEYGSQLKQEAPLVIVPRNGYELPAESKTLRHVTDLPIMHAGLSSTEVRERVSKEQPIAGLVCEAIDRYIETAGLYRSVCESMALQ